jgi:hypothetical protein
MAMAKSEIVAENRREKSLRLTHEWMSSLWKKQPGFDKGVRMSTHMHYAEQTKHVVWSFPESLKQLELIHITDVQFGHIACKVERVIEYRDWVLSAPNRYMLWGGDMIDAYALMKSPGSPWEEIGDSQKQANMFADIWGPARHRILGYVGGNHERRGLSSFGDLGVYIANLLQIPYSAGQQFIDIRFGDWQPFKAHLWHGGGAARTKGAKINSVHETMKKSDADLILQGHLHDPVMTFDWRVQRDKNNNISLRKQGGAMSSSFLEFWGTYGEVARMNPSDVMMACATVFPNGKWRLAFQ